MNLKDRDSLTDLLHQINDRFQALSRKIHWTVEDSACLDNLIGSKEQIGNITARITRATGSNAVEKTRSRDDQKGRLGFSFVVKLNCDKQITAKGLWHMRAECATVN